MFGAIVRVEDLGVQGEPSILATGLIWYTFIRSLNNVLASVFDEAFCDGAAVIVDAVDARAFDGFKLGLMQTTRQSHSIPYPRFPRKNVVNRP